LLASTIVGLGLTVALAAMVDRLHEAQPPTLGDLLHVLAQSWGGPLRLAYAFLLECYVVGVAFRAAACVVRERQMQTLDMLLTIPVERRTILYAKWLGALYKGWAWVGLLCIDLVTGLLIGAYHPF